MAHVRYGARSEEQLRNREVEATSVDVWATTLVATYLTDPDVIAAVLPPPIEPGPEPLVKVTVFPSIATDDGDVPRLTYWACANSDALIRLPLNPVIAEIRAWFSNCVKCGIAKAARIPRMVITTTSSINVNPAWGFCTVRSLRCLPVS